MSVDSVVAIAWDVLKKVAVPIKRRFGYVMSSKSYADLLREEVGKLEYEAERIRIAAEVARNNNRNVYSRVTVWQESAEKALKESRELLSDFEKASKTCCYGTLPDPNCRYQFSRKAKDKIEVVQRLARECSEFKDICFSDPTPGNVAAPAPAGREGRFESRAAIIRDIMVALAEDSNSVVGIHGMGGVGKSTLLVDAERRIKEEKQFDLIAKADVSENPDIKRIQGEIADALGLGDIKNKESVSGRAELLHRRLENEEREKKKVLIILDNLWEGLDLKSVGIPCGHDNKVGGCKLLLTSRDRNILQREMGCDKDFPLDRLEEEEARILFERIVGEKVHNDECRPMVDEALRKCAGLPLLIVAMAKHFKYAPPPEWRDALNQIEWSTNEGISGVINTVLQLSYDHLKSEEAKSLLHLCAAYGVSEPSVENLVRYGYGLGIFRKDSSMREARDRLSTLIRTLQASSLLLDNVGADGFKIHDLVRDFVARLILRDHPLILLKDKDTLATQLRKERLKSCTAICFPYIDMEELPEELDCPELRIFLLFTNSGSLEVSDSFFNSMKKLAVLSLTSIRVTCSPTPFQFLGNLHTLCLQRCSLEDVAILGKLKGLQILSFVGSDIQQLPKEVGKLVELRLLDLNYCSQLQIIEPGVLGSLIKLEELYMEYSFDRWNAVEQTPPTNACLIELNHMKNLCTLHVSVSDPTVLPGDLNIEKLTNYKIRIGNKWRWGEYKGSTILDLELAPINDVLRKGCIQSILGKTDDLFLNGLDGVEHSICALSQKGFSKLKHLQVENSPSIHYILQSPSYIDFNTLESLLLENLINLKKICHSYISSSKSFSTLKVIRVENCDKLEVLFPLSLLRGLPQLEEIEVVGCKLMRGIVEADDCGKVELRNLHVLKLRDLPNIKSFFTAGTSPSSSTSDDQAGTQIVFFNGKQVSIPSLESLTMERLPNVKEIWSDESPLGQSNLQSLNVVGCKYLSKVISSRSLLKLHKLHTLTIKDCVAVQEIFDLNRPSANGNVETLSQLTTLELNELPSLRCIWNKSPCRIVSFHNLKELKMHDADNLEYLFFPSMIKSLAQLRDLSISNCKKMEAIITEEEGLGTETSETPAFSILTNLRLERLESLTRFSRGKRSREAQCQDRIQSRSTALFNREVAFPRLETLYVSGLDKLGFIFFPSMVKSLSQLRDLTVSNCKKMEAIIMEEEEGSGMETSETLAFPMLNDLCLNRLRSLTCFSRGKCSREAQSQDCIQSRSTTLFNQEVAFPSSGGYTLKFPLLKDVNVNRCPNMKFFFDGPIEAPKLERVHVALMKSYGPTIYCYFWKGNLNITIQNMFEEMAAFVGVKEMQLSEFPQLIGKWHSELNPINSSWQLQSLVVDKCPSFVNAIPSKLMLVLGNMSTLQVRDCESLEEIFDLEGLEALESTRVLPSFKTLDLVNLPKLRQLWNKDLQGMMRFHSLTDLTLYKCSNLRHAFAPSMARCLANLLRMKIKECSQMEGVIADDEGQGSVVETITFPRLCRIKLECLPSLTGFLKGKNQKLKCPQLGSLTIAHCPRMRSLTCQSWMENDHDTPSLFNPQVQFPQLELIFLSHMDTLSKLWTDGPQETLTFDDLQKVEVQNCKSLVNLFPHWVATSLTQLEKLRVESCGIEEIVTSGDDTPHSNIVPVLFPKLTSLVLHDMPQLKSFCTNLPTLKWPFLKELLVTHCEKVDMLSFVASMNKWTHIDNQQDLSNQEAHSTFERDFPNLERLLLVDKDIRMIQDGKFPEDTFSKPKALTLACFHDEKAVFPLKFLLERFQNLQSLEVFCSSFEAIFPNERLVDEEKHSVLENLRELKLSKLHNLKHVWRGDYLEAKILRSIETFEVWDCPCLTTIFPTVTSFQNLTKLEVKDSFGLEHLVTVSAVTNLEHLTNMTIIGCERMKEVVANDGNGEAKVISLGKLEYLTLCNLPSLECFSSATSCSFKFPSLWSIEVEECPKMKIFSKGTLSTPQLTFVRLFKYP